MNKPGFIKLTQVVSEQGKGVEVLVAVDRIITIEERTCWTQVRVEDTYYYVKETPEEILILISKL